MAQSITTPFINNHQTRGPGTQVLASFSEAQASVDTAESWEAAAYQIETAAKKAAPTRLDSAEEKVRAVMDFQLPLEGWVGYHSHLWVPQLHDAAKTAGVELTMEVVKEHWWYGTTYDIIVEGPQDAVDRFENWYYRRWRSFGYERVPEE